MLKIPFEELLNKISEKSGLSQEQILEKVNQKMAQLSGLISKEGAATIIANELNVKLVEHSGKIKDIYPGMKNVGFLGKITQVFDVKEFNRSDGSPGSVASFLVGDDTGITKVVCWGSQTSIVKQLKQDDIVHVKGALAKEGLRGFCEVHINERAHISINPSGETVELKQPLHLNVERKKLEELNENDSSVEVFGTVRQVFDPTFFEVCSQCGKRIKEENSVFNCLEHGIVTPDYAYVLNLYLDDGTASVRTVLFRDQANDLLKKSKDEILAFKDNPQAFEQIKVDLLGEQFKVVGRVKKNTFMNRIELIAQKLLPGDPAEELARLEKVLK
ncbi:DUF2240 family protein [Candidatus Woesearchaeota archaeon]|nr:DUF2240 family protein [Candidatus Woesearchaeota archaeon]